MIKLTLPDPKKNKTGYVIYINSEHKYTFKNLKKAKKVKVEIECILNNSFDLCNELFKNSFSSYREMYLFVQSRFEQNQLKNLIIDLENSFYQITSELYKSSSNGAYFIYHKLINVLTDLKTFNQILYQISDNKRQYSLSKVLKTNVRQLLTELEYLTELNLFNNKQIKNKSYEMLSIV